MTVSCDFEAAAVLAWALGVAAPTVTGRVETVVEVELAVETVLTGAVGTVAVAMTMGDATAIRDGTGADDEVELFEADACTDNAWTVPPEPPPVLPAPKDSRRSTRTGRGPR